MREVVVDIQFDCYVDLTILNDERMSQSQVINTPGQMVYLRSANNFCEGKELVVSRLKRLYRLICD